MNAEHFVGNSQHSSPLLHLCPSGHSFPFLQSSSSSKSSGSLQPSVMSPSLSSTVLAPNRWSINHGEQKNECVCYSTNTNVYSVPPGCWGGDPEAIRQCPCLTDHRILLLVFTILGEFARSFIEHCPSWKGLHCLITQTGKPGFRKTTFWYRAEN